MPDRLDMGGAPAHLLASSHPVGHGFRGKPSLRIVMRENLRSRFSYIGKPLASDISYVSMDFAAARLQQRLVRGVLDQCVLEPVHRLRRNPVDVKYFSVGYCFERGLQLIFRCGMDSVQKLV